MSDLKRVHELIKSGKFYEALDILQELRKQKPGFLPYEQCYEYLVKKTEKTKPTLRSAKPEIKGDIHILFVLPSPLDTNHGYQVQLLARYLRNSNFDITIAVPDEVPLKETNNIDFSVFNYSSILSAAPGPYSIIHAWTPREIVRRFCETYLEKYDIPLIVHLEDNEEYLSSVSTGIEWEELCKLSIEELDRIIPLNRYHPIRGRAFLDRAIGLTMVIETLNRYNKKGVPYVLLPPMADERLFYPRPINYSLREKLGIPNDTIVLCYTGNVHEANYKDVYELYKAVEMLNAEGYPTVLLRTGLDQGELTKDWPKNHVINFGLVKREELPEIMAAADIFVQPGGNNPFDNERFPSKLPEYFAMGRPIVLVKNNWTFSVEHLIEAYLLAKSDAESIFKAIKDISKNEKLGKILSEGSINFYINKLVDANNETLCNFYKGLIEEKTIINYNTFMKSQRSFRKNYKVLSDFLNCYETLSVNITSVKDDIFNGHDSKIGLIFNFPTLMTYREHQLYNPLPFASRKKKLYILTNEDIQEEMLPCLYIIEHFAWINFVDCILISEKYNISLWNKLLPMFKNNRHFYVARPKKNFDNFIRECIGGLQKLHERLIIFSNPYYLSSEAIEYADGIILDLRQLNDNLEYISFSILTDDFINSFQFRYKDVRNSIPFIFNKNEEIDCTLITSIFKSDRFIKNFYNNTTQLEGYDKNIAHVILISSISDYELEIIQDWFNNYRNIIIVWQREDPGLYECWNIGIRLAKSKFISNANVDDMRHPKHVQTLLNDLKSRPHVAVACTVLVPFYNLVSDYKEIPLNEIWYTHQVGEFSFKDLAYLEKDETGNYHLKPHNIPHCMPVWRKRLHEDYGYFDEKNYGTYADWAFWLKVTYLGEIGYLNPEPLSFYFVNLDSHNRRGDKLQEFHKRIEKEFIPYFYWINLERVK